METGSGHGEEIFQYGGIHFNTEYPVLNVQTEYDTAIRGKMGEGNLLHSDKIKCSWSPPKCVHKCHLA